MYYIGGLIMTVFKVIESIYKGYSRQLCKKTQKKMLNDISIELKHHWPELINITSLYISNEHTSFNIMLGKDLMTEFINKYPDALV